MPDLLSPEPLSVTGNILGELVLLALDDGSVYLWILGHNPQSLKVDEASKPGNTRVNCKEVIIVCINNVEVVRLIQIWWVLEERDETFSC